MSAYIFGNSLAALVDVQRLGRMQARFDALTNRIESGFAVLSEAEGLAEIDALSASVCNRRTLD